MTSLTDYFFGFQQNLARVLASGRLRSHYVPKPLQGRTVMLTFVLRTVTEVIEFLVWTVFLPGVLCDLRHTLGRMKADGGWRQGTEHPLRCW